MSCEDGRCVYVFRCSSIQFWGERLFFVRFHSSFTVCKQHSLSFRGKCQGPVEFGGFGRDSALADASPPPHCPFTAHDSLGEQQALGCPALDCVWDTFSMPGFARNMTGRNEKALLKNALLLQRRRRRQCNLGGRRLQSVGEESKVAVCLGETRRIGARSDGILKCGSIAQRSHKGQRRISLSTGCHIHSLF